MLKNNKDLVTADDHTTIWRYMDFSSFYALLVGYTAEIDQTFRGNMEMCSADI